MAARPTLLRQLRLVRSADNVPPAGCEAGVAPAVQRRASHSGFGAAGSAAAALVAVACAFGPMPDQSGIRDATAGESGAGTSRTMIGNFLSDSRKYLGL